MIYSCYELVFNYYDVNGDGKISLAELQQWLKVIHEKLFVEDLEAVVLFQDGDGLLGLMNFLGLWKLEGRMCKARNSF